MYFDVTVKNQGDRDAAAFKVRIASDGLDKESSVDGGLKAGQATTLRRQGPLQIDGFQTIYWVQATADSENAIDETREDNNDMYVTVTPQQPPQPPPMPPMPPIPPHASAPRVLLAE